MKQLKFMLAAATAIGLASAAQAGYLSGSTDFETGTVESLFTYNGEPAVQDGDNESEIADGAAVGVAVGNNNFTGDKAKKLKVNTGTTPILRSVNGSDAGEPLANGNIYIDTLVKFTVTPNDDEPAPVEGDKLLIYLKEDLSDAANPKTNLVAQAGFLGADGLEGEPYVLNANKKIEANTWYRLTVTAYANAAGPLAGSGVYYPAFSVKIDNVACVADKKPFVEGNDAAALIFLNSPLHEQIDKKEIMLSLDQEATISFVGFAGEGEVDDLVISTFDPAKTVVDFTLALDDTVGGISGKVTYSCNAQSGELSGSVSVSCYTGDTVTVSYSLKSETEYSASWTGATVIDNAFEVNAETAGDTITLVISKNAPSGIDFTFEKGTGVSAVTWTINDNTPAGKVKAGDVIKITDVDYVDLYVPGMVKKGYEKTITADEVAAGVAISVTVDAKPLTGEGAVAVPEGTTAAQIGVDTGTTGLADASATELTAIVKWADTFKTGTATAIETVNSMVFDGKEPKNEPAEAFLLNCSVADLATKKGEFKFEDFDASNVDNWLQSAIEKLKGKYQNGNVVPQRAQNLGVWYGDEDVKPDGFAPKFFRAKLIRK